MAERSGLRSGNTSRLAALRGRIRSNGVAMGTRARLNSCLMAPERAAQTAATSTLLRSNYNRSYHRSVQTFANGRDAKEFIIGRIVEEARRENVPLSEVERKMLYSSETAWTLPDMATVHDAFDREYDQAKYEQKIAGLIRKVSTDARANNQLGFEAWTEAVRSLRKEDHYLLVMIAAGSSDRPRGEFLKLVVTALAVVAVLTAIAFFQASR